MFESILPPLIEYATGILFATIILVLPGIAFSLNLARREITWPELASVGIMSGLTLNFIALFSLNYLLKKPITYYTLLLVSLSLTLLFLIIRITLVSKSGDSISAENILNLGLAEHGLFESTVLVAAILFITLLTLGVHSQYQLPYHMDEWLHLSLSVQIIEENGLKFINPNYPIEEASKSPDYTHHRLEAGYHTLLASFCILGGFEPVKTVQFLPALVTALICLNMYSLVYMLSKNFKPALYSIIFFTGLKTSMSLLGPWLLVPQAMGFAYIYLIFYCFEAGRRGILRMHYAGMLNLLGAALVHPQTAALLYLVLAVYAVLTFIPALFVVARRYSGPLKARLKMLLNEYRGFLLGVLLYILFPLTGFTYFFKIIWRGTLWDTITDFFTRFIFFNTMLEIPVIYTLEFPLEHYGRVSAVFFVLGFLILVLKRRHAILTSSVVVCFAILLLYHQKGYTIFMSYERLLYYCFIFMTPLSGLGLFYTLDFVLKKLGAFSLTPVIGGLVPLLLAASMVQGYYVPRDKLPVILRVDEYHAVEWLSSTGSPKTVLARARISNAIYPVSGNKVVAMTPRGSGYSKGMKALHSFFMSKCDGKKEVLTEFEVDYVLDNQKLDCDFLREVYSTEGIQVYEVVL